MTPDPRHLSSFVTQLDRVLDAAADRLDTAPPGTSIDGDTLTIRRAGHPDYVHRIPGVELAALR